MKIPPKHLAPQLGRSTRKLRFPGYHWVPPRYMGIAVARAIVLGDVDYAFKLYAQLRDRGLVSWRVCEARAILGALAAAKVWWPRMEVNPHAFGL